jgi:hypothetical protein
LRARRTRFTRQPLKGKAGQAGASTKCGFVPVMPRARAKDLLFRSEMERQILEINDAFSAYVDNGERRSDAALTRECDLEKRLRSAESRLGEIEREKQDAEWRKRFVEDRLVDVERQKRDVEEQLLDTAWRLRELQRTPIVRFVRFLSRSIPSNLRG